MDLKHDWKALNEVLFHQSGMVPGASTLVLLEENDTVVDGVASNGRGFSECGIKGLSNDKDKLDGLASKYGTDQTVVLSKKLLDQYVIDAAALGTNYFQQLQFVREKVLNQVGRRKSDLIVSRRHFVLDLFGRQLKRALPRRFNVVIFIDERPASSFAAGVHGAALKYRSILLSYTDGQLDQFFEPDFSSLHENRLQNWMNESDAIGQYLEHRYMLSCYGIFMHQDEWIRCLEDASGGKKPWQQFVKCYDEHRAAIYPAGITAKALLAAQRLMVYFARP